MSDNLRTFAKNIKHDIDMKKAVFILAILVLGVSGLRAQHFEWAKGYSSSQEGNVIKGSVTDSAGNLYILGVFSYDAEWEDSHVLPIAPYGYGCNTGNALIAKITPDGTMAWKKVIHANGNQNPFLYDIKPVGDTAFACLIDIPLPRETTNYLYYLDTLLTTNGDYPTPNGNMSYMTRTAFITFDFEGHVLEQHFLTLTYLDNDGNDLMRHYDPPITPSDWYINATGNYQSTFDVDADGNVYFCRIAYDRIDQTYATWLGTIGGIKYWVDGRVVGLVEVQNNPLMWYPQLLKFSPHMDTLLASRYLVQRCDTNIDYQTNNLYLKSDHNNNLYLIGTWDQSFGVGNKIIIDSAMNISFYISSANSTKGFMGKFNSDLEAIQGISLEDSIIHSEINFSGTEFSDISFDNDSNMLFLSACTGRSTVSDTLNFYSVLMCQGHPLSRLRNDVFIIAFRIQDDTLAYQTYGRVPSKYGGGMGFLHGNIDCANNRVFIQSQYRGGVNFPQQNVLFPNWGNIGLGLSIFDYQGNIIKGIDYSAISVNNKPGFVSLHDTILYLSSSLVSNATFGDIQVSVNGSNACIAKYIDPAFLTPYIHIPDTDSIGLPEVEPDLLYVYPNPAHGELFLSVGDEQITGVNLTTLMGQRKPVLFSNGMVSLSGFPAGMYFIEVTTNKNKYHKKIIIL